MKHIPPIELYMIGKGSLSSIYQISKIIQAKKEVDNESMLNCLPNIKICGNTFYLKVVKTFIYNLSQIGIIIRTQNMKHIFLIQKELIMFGS